MMEFYRDNPCLLQKLEIRNSFQSLIRNFLWESHCFSSVVSSANVFFLFRSWISGQSLFRLNQKSLLSLVRP